MYSAIFIISLLGYFNYNQSRSCQLLMTQQSYIPAIILVAFYIIIIGLRPVSYAFGDTGNYARIYSQLNSSASSRSLMFQNDSEWLWRFIVTSFKGAGFTVHALFLLVCFVYTLSQWCAVRLLLWENTWMAILFIFSAFSFYTYSVNGIRNGMACAMLMLGLALFCKKQWWLAGILCFLSLGIHRSTALPILAMLIAYFVMKNVKYTLWVWLGSIVVSLVLGSYLQSIITPMYDSRMATYSTIGYEQFSHTGFRWDFLLYSAPPVWLAYYINVEKQIKDDTFNLIASTYMLANALWIILIRMPFSNRFAYLSWFLYPLVIAYGLIRVPIWKDQDQKAAYALLLHAGFTFFMFLIGKAF